MKKSLEEQVAELAAELASVAADHGKRLDTMGRVLDAIAAIFTGGGGEVNPASDAELDGQHGDPPMKFNPRDWKGTPRKGHQLSRCEPEALDAFAVQCLYFASKEDEKGEKDRRGGPKSKWSRRDAALAMGWAKRLRAGWKSPAGEAPKKDGWGRPIGSPPADVGDRAFSGFEQKTGAEGFEDSSGAGSDGADDEIPF